MNDEMNFEDKTMDDEGAMDGGMDKGGADEGADDERTCPSCGHSHADGVACDCGCDA